MEDLQGRTTSQADSFSYPLCFVGSLRFPKSLSYLTTFYLFERRGAVHSTWIPSRSLKLEEGNPNGGRSLTFHPGLLVFYEVKFDTRLRR
jgi:hypothetical protein